MLKAFSISGYKAYRHADIELAPLTLIYGQNSAGKSTIIEALHLAGAGVRSQLGDIGPTGEQRWMQFVEARHAFHHKGEEAPFHFGITSESETIFVTYAPDTEHWLTSSSDSPGLLLPATTSWSAVIREHAEQEPTDLASIGTDGENQAEGPEFVTQYLDRIERIKDYYDEIIESPDAHPTFPDAGDWERVPEVLAVEWLPYTNEDGNSHADLGVWQYPEHAVLDDESKEVARLLISKVIPIYIAAFYGVQCSTDAGVAAFLEHYNDRILPEIARANEVMTFQVQDELRLTSANFSWSELIAHALTAMSTPYNVTPSNEDDSQEPPEIRTGDYFISVKSPLPVSGKIYFPAAINIVGTQVTPESVAIGSPVSSHLDAVDDRFFATADALRALLTDALNVRLNNALAPVRSPWVSIGPSRRRPEWLEDISLPGLKSQFFAGSDVDVSEDGHLFPAVIYLNRSHGLEFRVNQWLRKLGIPYEYSNGEPEAIYEERRHGPKEITAYRFRPRLFDEARMDGDGNPIEVGFEDVGYGLNQILPVITQLCAPMPTDSLVTIQQPELHIHPKLQTELGDLFLEATMTNAEDPAFPPKQVIVETHSEHILLRIQRRIREGKVDPSHVAILYVDTDSDGGSVVHRIRLGAQGEFLDEWPDGFFGERLMEILGY
jgi:hypothetical protein